MLIFPSFHLFHEPIKGFFLGPPLKPTHQSTGRSTVENLTPEFNSFSGGESRLEAGLPIGTIETGRDNFSQVILSYGKYRIQDAKTIHLSSCHAMFS
jgi:hypothetical protein